MKGLGWVYAATAGAVILFVALLASMRAEVPEPPKKRAPARPVITSETIARVPGMIDRMNVMDAAHGVEGGYHLAKPQLEKDLWAIVSNLPTVDGGDGLLLRAIEEVYTQHHKNALVGYNHHYPYLDSSKAIKLAGKLELDYPSSPHLPRALFLKAYAWRVAPPTEDQVSDPDLVRMDWVPNPEEARRVYRDLQAMFPETEVARQAGEILKKDSLVIRLPIEYADDPRDE